MSHFAEEVERIPGSATLEELEKLRDLGDNSLVAIDVCAGKGRSTYALSYRCPCIFAVELREAKAFSCYMSDALELGKVFLLRRDAIAGAQALMPIMEYRKADLIVLEETDGDSLSVDIFNYMKLLAPGGIMCGIGWNNPGVRTTLSRLVTGWRAEGNLWFLETH
jgi:hypothetical protein